MSPEPIRKEATGRYLVVIDVAAPEERRRRLKRRFATYKEARAWLAETRSHVGAGSFVRPQKVTVEQWVTAWLPILKSQAADVRQLLAQPPVAPAADPWLRPLQSIKPADLSTHYAWLLTSGRADHA